MPNTIKTISLTDDDKSYLNKLLTQSTLEIRVYQRARILLLKSEGASNKAIADKLDIGISVVKRCLNKFKENGVEASLRDNKGRGRKAEITDDDITWVISKACQKPQGSQVLTLLEMRFMPKCRMAKKMWHSLS